MHFNERERTGMLPLHTVVRLNESIEVIRMLLKEFACGSWPALERARPTRDRRREQAWPCPPLSGYGGTVETTVRSWNRPLEADSLLPECAFSVARGPSPDTPSFLPGSIGILTGGEERASRLSSAHIYAGCRKAPPRHRHTARACACTCACAVFVVTRCHCCDSSCPRSTPRPPPSCARRVFYPCTGRCTPR